MTVIAAAVAAVLAFGGTGLMRRYALARQVLDLPNDRSSHVIPTPRGGGLAAVVAVVLVFGALRLTGIAGSAEGAGWAVLPLVGITLVAWIGWRDDNSSLTAGPRLVTHVVGALTLLPLVLSPSPVPAWMGMAAAAWWVFWGVSAINVINFMDGIDGLIGSQVVVFGLHLAFVAPTSPVSRAFGLILAGSAAGFLVWNWPPARIFMGDVGSGALGLALVYGGALLMRSTEIGLVTTFLPLFPLFLDALVTLVRRALRGEPITLPHRSHLYQRLANGGWGHLRVSVLYFVLAAVGMAVARLFVTGSGLWPVLSYLAGTSLLGVVLDRQAPGPTPQARHRAAT